MKKILLLLCVASCALTASAQGFEPYTHQWERRGPSSLKLERFLNRLFAPAPAKPAWVKAVENQVHKATPHQGIVGGVITDYVNYQKDAPTASAAVQQAKNKWNNALHENRSPLNRFKVRVPVVQDVEALDGTTVARVEQFLAGKMDLNVAVQEHEHYMVSVTLQDAVPVHLLFNCYFKELYVVRGDTRLPNVPLEPLTIKRPMK